MVLAGQRLAHAHLERAIRAAISHPEFVVLRHYGVLHSRGKMILMGIMEEFDLFTDLAFPFLAYTCDGKEVFDQTSTAAFELLEGPRP